MPQTAQQLNVALASGGLPAPLHLDASGALQTAKTAGGARAVPIVEASGALTTAKTAGGVATVPTVDAQGNINVNAGGTTSALDVSASTAIKATPGKLVRVNVLVAGAVGAVHDCAATGDAAAGNKIGVIPAVVGTYEFDWPCLVGITYVPGAAQVVSISYQ